MKCFIHIHNFWAFHELEMSKSVRKDIRLSGFVINERKSVWSPVQDLVWLGFCIDTVSPGKEIKESSGYWFRNYVRISQIKKSVC